MKHFYGLIILQIIFQVRKKDYLLLENKNMLFQDFQVMDSHKLFGFVHQELEDIYLVQVL